MNRRRSIYYRAVCALLVAATAKTPRADDLVQPAAKPSAPLTYSVVQKAADSVFRLLSNGCQVSGRPAPNRVATGFAADLDGSIYLITALHSVAGCTDWEIQYRGSGFDTSVTRVYRTADLALLSLPSALKLPGLKITDKLPDPGQRLEALAWGSTPTLNPSQVFVRLGGGTRIVDLVQNSKIIKALEAQKFPDVNAKIINLESPLTPGDSGAPIINGSGEVVGVANGNLLEGTRPHSWAFPASTIRALVSSSDRKLPSSSVTKDVLVSEEVAPTSSTSRNATINTLTCGVRDFRFRGTQTFSRLVATADAFSAAHIQTVQAYAKANQKTIKPDERFDVYVDDVSGADFIVPSGFSIIISGQDCIATDAANELEMRISTDAVPDFRLTTPPANAFAARTVRPYEAASPNPPFITPPVSRVDGMAVQRYAYFYGFVGQPPPVNEGYITYAWRRDTLLEVSVRTLVPALGARHSATVFPSIVSVYAATFTM